jgi:hypothetical protein
MAAKLDELMGLLAGPLGLLNFEALAPPSATPGDARGGFLKGQPDQLQKLPSSDQGHGGEFVVNAEATKRYRPLLEAMNRAVPAGAGIRPERPSQGRAFYAGGDTGDEGGVGSEGAGPAGSSASGDDAGVSTDTATGAAADSVGMNAGQPGPPGDPLSGASAGMSLSAAHGDPAAVSSALSGALSGAIGGLGVPGIGTTPDATAVALGTALGVMGLGPAAGPAAGAAVGAANAQTAAISGMTGMTPGEISDAMAAANQTAADAAAGTGVGPGGQGGAEGVGADGEARWPGGQPIALSDYMAWLRSATTAPVRSPLITPQGTFALRAYHSGGVVQPSAKGLKAALIMAEPGEFVIARGPAKKYRRLLDAINADDPTRIRTHATLREALTR